MSENENNIDKIDDELKVLKKRKSDLLKEVSFKSKQTYRKERARRLIETGALAEKYFKLNGIAIEDREEIFKMFSTFVTANIPKKFIKKEDA